MIRPLAVCIVRIVVELATNQSPSRSIPTHDDQGGDNPLLQIASTLLRGQDSLPGLQQKLIDPITPNGEASDLLQQGLSVLGVFLNKT
ncbi:MAG: hypothetical protein H6R19_1013 [Proteobacteria bacterium]|nr:hypothetical protein [Pseudomonadota bacterium]